MSISGGPSIINDNLVLYYDLDNPDSYPGMPTTNICTAQYPEPSFLQYTGTGYNYWTDYFNWADTGVADLGYISFSGELRVSKERYDNRGTNWGLNRGYIWTASTTDGWIRSVGTPSTYNEEWTYFHLLLQRRDTEDKNSVNNTGNGDTLYVRHGLYHYPGTYDDGSCFARNLQIEVGTIASQFTTGTRSTTNALKDISGNNEHSNLTNVSYETGGVLRFNSNNANYILTGYGNGKNPSTQPLTYSFWVKTNNASGDQMFASQSSALNNQRAYFGLVGGYWAYGIQSSGWAASGIAADTNWHNITIVFDNSGATDYAYFYLDGVQIYSKSYTSFTFHQNLYIGKYDTSSSYCFDGYINKVMVYEKALSANEVLHNYNIQKGRFGLS